MCVSICISVISASENQIIAKVQKLSILDIHHMEILLETSYEDQASLCPRTYKRILIHYDLWTKFHFSAF